MIEVKVPALPESVADATIATWHKKVGDRIKRDENLVDLETDKVVLEVPSPVDGVLQEMAFKVGATVKSGEVLAQIEQKSSNDDSSETKASTNDAEHTETAESGKVEPEKAGSAQSPSQTDRTAASLVASPSARRLMAEHGVSAEQFSKDKSSERITKQEITHYIQGGKTTELPRSNASQGGSPVSQRQERRVPMSRLRVKIAERLVEAQHQAAMLTTFNEVDLSAIMALRKTYQADFEKKHGVKLGFMSFFTKAAVVALNRFPIVNASIDGQDMVYHDFYDIGIAVSTERGLVVPVVRDADQLSLAEIEKRILQAAEKARTGQLTMEEIQGGTFTITNGGVFGSLLSTPIINPPQSAILGMHKIEERPRVVDGQLVIRPMMYLALSYDHRIIDGKDSVQFLVTLKTLLEDPSRLILDV